MRSIFLFLFSISCFVAGAQQNTAMVSMNGIGELKIGMKLPEVEKITGQKIKLVNLLRKDDSWQRDTIRLVHKGVSFNLVFDNDFHENSKGYIVYEISSDSPQLKTRSGLGIGDEKLKIVSTYFDYLIHIVPEYEGEAQLVKSKTRSSVWLFGDTSETVIIFHLVNNKIASFSVMYNEGC